MEPQLVNPATPNRWSGAFTNLEAIVLHTTEGGGLGSLSWLRNPDSFVSCLLVVMEDGTAYRLGPVGDAYWHAGIVNKPATPLAAGINPNLRMHGIEFAGYHDRPLTAAQMRTAAWLVPWLRSTCGAPADTPCIPHSWLDTVNRFDPGAANLAAILIAIGGGDVDYAQIEEQVKGTIRVMLTSPEGAALVEAALRYPGGYADKLQQFLDDNYARRLSALIRRRTHNPRRAPAQDLRGPRDSWPEGHR